MEILLKEDLEKEMLRINGEVQSIEARAKGEGRKLNDDEEAKIADLISFFEGVQSNLKRVEAGEVVTIGRRADPQNPEPQNSGDFFHQRTRTSLMTKQTGNLQDVRTVFAMDESKTRIKTQIFGTKAKKDYASLFGESIRNQYSIADWAGAVFSGRYHPAIYNADSMQEGIGTEGGYAVPQQFAKQIWDLALEGEIVFPRANVVPMTSNSLIIPAYQIGNHAENLFGGVVTYFAAELETLKKSKPKLREITVKADKMYSFATWSGELNEDALGLISDLAGKFGQAIGFNRDRRFLISGTGAGMPLSIYNAPCTISVTRESTDDILYCDLVDMLARLNPGSFTKAVWVAHVTCLPKLLSLTIPVRDDAGDIVGGSHVPALKETGGEYSLLTRPLFITEKMQPLGEKGDLLLADFSQYLIGVRRPMRFEVSIHELFSSDEVSGRLITRLTGLPLWDEPLTLLDGSTTVSPFVLLDESVGS